MKTHGINVWTIKRASAFASFWKKLTEINADIYVHRAGVGPEFYLLTALFCLWHNRVYVHVLAYAPLTAPVTRPLGFLRWRICFPAALRLAGAIVTNSQRRLRQGMRKEAKVIPTGKALPKPFRVAREHLLWVGRPYHDVKRPELFIELAKCFPRERFLMRLAARSKLVVPANVRVFCNVPHEELDAYYASSKLLVHTSKSESFPNVFLESWKNKTPVVSTVDPDGVIKAHGLGRHSQSFEQLVKDVGMLLSDNKEWQTCSENGYRYVLEHHDITRTIEEYKKLFRKLADSKKLPV